jgi:prepilin-type processing-associated H-X9-DG protein
MYDSSQHFPSATVQRMFQSYNDMHDVTDPTANATGIMAWNRWNRVAWPVPLLPFMEQGARHGQIVESVRIAAGNVGGMETYSGHNAAWEPITGSSVGAYHGNVAGLICPSEGERSPINNSLGLISYRGNAGDHMVINTVFDTITRGMFGRGDRFTADTGSVPDGLSNTLMFSEGWITPAWATHSQLAGGTVQLGTSDATMEVEGYVVNCRNSIGPNRTIATPRQSQLGGRWADGYHSYNLFHTILPPNSPTCGRDSERVLAAAGSYHTGGVNVALGDGSARFISESINAGNPQADWTVTRDSEIGPSRFGVWGALGTRNGGETTGL